MSIQLIPSDAEGMEGARTWTASTPLARKCQNWAIISLVVLAILVALGTALGAYFSIINACIIPKMVAVATLTIIIGCVSELAIGAGIIGLKWEALTTLAWRMEDSEVVRLRHFQQLMDDSFENVYDAHFQWGELAALVRCRYLKPQEAQVMVEKFETIKEWKTIERRYQGIQEDYKGRSQDYIKAAQAYKETKEWWPGFRQNLTIARLNLTHVNESSD